MGSDPINKRRQPEPGSETSRSGCATRHLVLTGAAVLGFFVLLGVAAVSPALFRSNRIAALDVPDTWCHTWAFGRAHLALRGDDHGYFVSHLLTYPGVVREPIAVFDPLLAWMSLPLQRLLPNVATVYNVLLAFGLAFTAFSGYLFCRGEGYGRWGAIFAGVVMGFNPFTYRLLLGGYSEYAWWGLIPLALFFGRRAARSRRSTAVIPYVITLWVLGLFSIYLAAYLGGVVVCLLIAGIWRQFRGGPAALRPFLRVQLQASAALLPLFIFWGVHLSALEFKGFQWGRPFDLKALHIETASRPEAGGAGGPVLSLDEHSQGSEAENFIPYRTLRGSLDLADLVPFAGEGRARWLRRDAEPGDLPDGILAFEQTAWWEWVVLLAMALAGWRNRARRGWIFAWLWVAALFATLSLGPYLKWRGDIYDITLPYGWLYQWVPGAARLNIAGRAFLVSIMALAVGAAAGMDGLVQTRRYPHIAKLLLAGFAVWQLWLGLASHGGFGLPATRAEVPDFYHDIAHDTGDFALLELPTRGAIDKRMHWQATHGRPIYKGVAATEWTEVEGVQSVATNSLVAFLDRDPFRASAAPSLADWKAAAEALTALGFRYLILHADGYATSGEFAQAVEMTTRREGAPCWNRDDHVAWRL